jgi:TetR/AcrR family transcriptional repressor of lmrAB and yxaGH operons
MAARAIPPQEQSGSRQRLVTAAARLFSRQGYEATTVKDIAREGAAPMGSFYFHFPGGKEELGLAALGHGGGGFGDLLRQTLWGDGPVEDALAGCALVLAEGLQDSDWRDGCPVATVALESVTRSPALRNAAAEAFQAWQHIIAERLVAAGLPEPAARELSATALALLEGAELLARVQASTTPLEHAAAGLRTLVRAALHPAARGGGS